MRDSYRIAPSILSADFGSPDYAATIGRMRTRLAQVPLDRGDAATPQLAEA